MNCVGIAAIVAFSLVGVSSPDPGVSREKVVRKPPVRSTTTYQYDRLHRLTKVIYPGNVQIVYEYDAVGNRTTKMVVHT
jgi:YD repeat-containing protein